MPNRFYPYFRLKELRTRYGWKQAELAKKLGVGKNTICNLERGKTAPSPKVLLAIRQLFGDEVFLPPVSNPVRSDTDEDATE